MGKGNPYFEDLIATQLEEIETVADLTVRLHSLGDQLCGVGPEDLDYALPLIHAWSTIVEEIERRWRECPV